MHLGGGKKIYSTHLAIQESILTIKLLGIMDLETASEIRVENDSTSKSMYKTETMSIRSILMDITIPSSDKPLFKMIVVMADSDSKGVIPTGAKREDKARKVADHVTLAVMYHVIFNLDAHLYDIIIFTQAWFSRGRGSRLSLYLCSRQILYRTSCQNSFCLSWVFFLRDPFVERMVDQNVQILPNCCFSIASIPSLGRRRFIPE